VFVRSRFEQGLMEEQLAGRLFLLLVSTTIDYVAVSAAIVPIMLPASLA